MMTYTSIPSPTKIIEGVEQPSYDVRRFSRLQWLSIGVIAVSVLCRTYLPETLTISAVVDILGTCGKSLASLSKAKSITPVVSRPFAEYGDVWEEPMSSEDLFDNSTKIIWGYWNTFPDNFPWLCQKALQSWQLRNPQWRVIMLNDVNFRKYVSINDLPSTFYSLKVQHRSDLIRLAVLIRYGGAYIDASTLVYKGLDGIWNTTADDKVMLTSLNQLSIAKLDMYNNGLLMTKGSRNPFLLEWRRRILEYSEAPAYTLEQMKEHPAFRRVHQFWEDPALGVLGGMIPYHSNLWMMNDLIWHDDLGLSKHIVHLPRIRWSFYYHSLPHFFDKLKIMTSLEAQDPVHDPEAVEWTPFYLLWSIVRHLTHCFFIDHDLAKGTIENIHMLKFTSHDMPLVDVAINKVGTNNTGGRIIEAAYTLQRFPIQQATLVGAKPPSLI
jgi:Capsular polysaccharide synthesis protein